MCARDGLSTISSSNTQASAAVLAVGVDGIYENKHPEQTPLASERSVTSSYENRVVGSVSSLLSSIFLKWRTFVAGVFPLVELHR